MEAALRSSSQEQNFWCQGCLCLMGCSQHRAMFDMEGASSPYLIFLTSLEAGISFGGPSERRLWLGTRGSSLSLDPLWSSGWSFLPCLGLKEQSLPWSHDQGAQSRPWGDKDFRPTNLLKLKMFFHNSWHLQFSMYQLKEAAFSPVGCRCQIS